jgi:FkbM family methyltransferase
MTADSIRGAVVNMPSGGTLKSLKLLLRNMYAACLNRVPDAWLLPIRSAYIGARAGSVRRTISHRLLKLVRYKHPDRQLQSFRVVDEPAVRLTNVNSIVVRHVYWFGLYGWEGSEIRAWQYFCSRARNILEIGANIGFYTVSGAHKAAQAHYTAVEPHPHTVQILRRNLELNRLDGVRVVEAAVVGAKTADHMTLVVPAADQDETPPGSFLQAGGEVSRRPAASYDVPVAAIQDLIGEVDLLKLDVEGYEFDILNSVRDVLMRTRPVIFVEVLREATKLQHLIAELARSGAYRIFACGPTVAEVDADDMLAARFQKRYGTRDVFLVPANSDVSELRTWLVR